MRAPAKGSGPEPFTRCWRLTDRSRPRPHPRRVRALSTSLLGNLKAASSQVKLQALNKKVSFSRFGPRPSCIVKTAV